MRDFNFEYKGFNVEFKNRSDLSLFAKDERGATSYVIRLNFNTLLDINVKVRRRTKFSIFLYHLGFGKVFDVLTGYRFFDSRYQIICKDKKKFKSTFSDKVIRLFELLDKSDLKLLNKNGFIGLNRSWIYYREGPYNFTHHKFLVSKEKIEEITNHLCNIAEALEKKGVTHEMITQKEGITLDYSEYQKDGNFLIPYRYAKRKKKRKFRKLGNIEYGIFTCIFVMFLYCIYSSILTGDYGEDLSAFIWIPSSLVGMSASILPLRVCIGKTKFYILFSVFFFMSLSLTIIHDFFG